MHPIPYQGSKRQLAERIMKYMPEGMMLVEPFAGSCAVSIAALVSGKTSRAWVNDVNAPLMNLVSCMIEIPERISQQYRECWELGDYDLIRDRFNKLQNPGDLWY